MEATWPPDNRIRRTFAETAKAYDDLARRSFKRTATDLVDELQPRRAEKILDVACGSGIVGTVLAERGLGLPVGVDISAAMLALADGPRLVADAIKLPIRDGAFEVTFCSFGLQMLEDPDIGLTEIHRTLKPGGRAGVSMWGPETSELPLVARQVLDDALEAKGIAFPQVSQVSITEPGELQEAFTDLGFVGQKAWMRRRRTAYRSPRHYFEMLAVFPSTWIRLDQLAGEAATATERAITALTEALGGPDPFEVAEEVLMGVATKPPQAPS